MIFNSLDEVFSHMDEVRNILLTRVGELDEDSMSVRANGEGWCAVDLIEHLSITEKSITGVIEKLLEKSEKINVPAAADGKFPSPAKFPSVVRRTNAYKVEAPERVRPQGGVPVSVSLESLEASRAHLKSLRMRMAAVDLSQAKFPHPMIGEITLPQWLVFISEHEARHLEQLENILSSGKAPAAE